MSTSVNAGISGISLLFLLSFINPLYALEMDTSRSEEVIVRFESPLARVAGEVINLYPLVRGEIEKTFKSPVDFIPTVVLIRDRDTFQKIIGNSPVVAVAVSAEDLIIIDNSRMKSYPFTLKVTLKHELCHLYLYHYVKEGSLPRWLDEGIAQWVSDGIAELATGKHDNVLRQAILTDTLIRLDDISETFPEDERDLLLAYEESKSVVEYISVEYGPGGILKVLNLLREGPPADRAFLEGLGVSFEDLEKTWRNRLRRNTTWFSYVSDNLYQILFVLAALLLTYAFITAMVKKRRYKDDGDQEEDDIPEK